MDTSYSSQSQKTVNPNANTEKEVLCANLEQIRCRLQTFTSDIRQRLEAVRTTVEKSLPTDESVAKEHLINISELVSEQPKPSSTEQTLSNLQIAQPNSSDNTHARLEALKLRLAANLKSCR